MNKPNIHFNEPVTGSTTPSFVFEQYSVSDKHRIQDWFIRPLNNMSGEDVFACLILCFPLIESIIRLELKIPDTHDVKFSHNSPALKWFAEFASVPEVQARLMWESFRNGLLHRAMINIDMDYELSAARSGRVAEFKGNKVYLYVWELRDSVVKLIEKHHKEIWKNTSSPLPHVYSLSKQS